MIFGNSTYGSAAYGGVAIWPEEAVEPKDYVFIITEAEDFLITESGGFLIIGIRQFPAVRKRYTVLPITTRFTVEPIEDRYTVLPLIGHKLIK